MGHRVGGRRAGALAGFEDEATADSFALSGCHDMRLLETLFPGPHHGSVEKPDGCLRLSRPRFKSVCLSVSVSADGGGSLPQRNRGALNGGIRAFFARNKRCVSFRCMVLCEVVSAEHIGDEIETGADEESSGPACIREFETSSGGARES